MSFLEVHNARIAGLSACVPKAVVSNEDLKDVFGSPDECNAFAKITGIFERRSNPSITAADLGLAAAERLISDLGWQKDSIGALFFLSQSPDYYLPATSCILQDRLALSKDCYAADISLGCSGWIYGLSIAASVTNNCHGSPLKRALLIVGDARIDPSPLFGMACTATALEFSETDQTMKFHFGTDGSYYDSLIIPDGGARNGVTQRSFNIEQVEGHPCNRLQIHMNNVNVFSFGLQIAPYSVQELANHFGFDYLDYDYYILHQANKAMNDSIARNLKLPSDKVPSCIRYFGNTSSASIPLNIVTQLRGKLEHKHSKLICCGFGVGFSWGTVAFETNNIVISDLVELDDSRTYRNRPIQMS